MKRGKGRERCICACFLSEDSKGQRGVKRVKEPCLVTLVGQGKKACYKRGGGERSHLGWISRQGKLSGRRAQRCEELLGE